MVRQVITKEIEVEVKTCTMVQKDGVRKVKVCTPTWVDQEVVTNVCKTVERTGERVVHVPTWVEKEVVVCRMTPVEMTGTRKVAQPHTTKRMVDVSYCERVAYQTTIKVPVSVPCAPAPCPTPAPACCN